MEKQTMASTYADRINGVETATAIKPPARVATTANIALTGLQTIDGVTVAAGDRVLVKNQTNAANNGIWVASASAWTRAIDFNGARDMTRGTMVYVLDGTVNGDIQYILTTANPAIGGDLTFEIYRVGALASAYISQFSSLDHFNSVRASFDYWSSGSLVNVGDMTFQKRASDGGTIWVRVDQEADKLINSYLEDVAGSVEPRHLASIPAMSLLGNALVRQGRPRGIPYEEFFYNIGARWYGDTASGGINFLRSGTTPNAANAMRSGRGTSSAGATTVTFHTPFAPCIPNVIITPKATNLADTPLTVTQIGDAIPESFTFVIKNAAGTAVARDFNYFATGNGDY